MSNSSISVTRPVDQALARVKQVLFRPFDASKWFVIGFCAWLAYLGQGGGGYNFQMPGGRHGSVASFREGFEHARSYVLDNLFWIVPLAATVIVLCLGLWLLFTWLHSRGEFMFLHCVALNKAEVEVPWKMHASGANSLFGFRVVLGLVSTAIVSPPLILCGLRFIRMALDDAWSLHGVLAAVGLGLAFLFAALVFSLVRKFTADFVVPIMYRQRRRCWDAWAEFGRLLMAHLANFILYLLFQIVLGFAIAMVVLATVLVTCCIAGCLLALPYLGTVLLLPVLVFKRSYSLHYLAQYGLAYDVFAPAEPPAATGPAPLPQL
jgi:hypothetical protein